MLSGFELLVQLCHCFLVDLVQRCLNSSLLDLLRLEYLDLVFNSRNLQVYVISHGSNRFCFFFLSILLYFRLLFVYCLHFETSPFVESYLLSQQTDKVFYLISLLSQCVFFTTNISMLVTKMHILGVGLFNLELVLLNLS